MPFGLPIGDSSSVDGVICIGVVSDVEVGNNSTGVDVAGSNPLLGAVGDGESGEIGDSAGGNTGSGAVAPQEVLRTCTINKVDSMINVAGLLDV
ncbi:MAG: hypothetical protein HYR94_12020 [Chloroflexi bacterium]|nr:hypothetical protein [Chloroflexota bacterium]